MSDATSKLRIAWQPLTLGGVAAFAGAPPRRLWLVQFIFAAVIAAAVVWCVDTAWYPVLQRTIHQLPDSGEIRGGKLDWPDPAPRLLAGGRFISIGVDLDHTGAIRSPAHLQIELGRTTVRFISLFGDADCPYPRTDWIVACNRTELEPWWGAWAVPMLGITFVFVCGGLMATWALLATAFFSPVWLAGFFANRQLSLSGSWKLAGAALMPGAILITAAILFYGIGFLDLVQLLAAGAAQLLVGLTYALASLFFAPRLSRAVPKKGNPFAT